MQNNRKITIAVGSSRKATAWHNQELNWSDFVQRLSTPTKTTETYADYMRMAKIQQDDLKDVGGFVGGELSAPKRKAANVKCRHLVTLDADNIPAGQTQDIINKVDAMGCAYVIYSTRKHCSAKPRLRIIFPLNRACTADEYEPLARKAASLIGMDYMDPTTFQASRLMYWPSVSSDGEYVYAFEDKGWINVDGFLAKYTDWHNHMEWPVVPGASEIILRAARKQGDPTEKSGIVGAFCRTYDIEAAIDKYLQGVYTPCDDGSGRYTFAGGSTSGGAVLYENGKFLYSHHATDPCSARLVNSFDLVRIHRFADLDDEAKPDTPSNRLPSYVAMRESAAQDPQVTALLAKEEFSTPFVDSEDEGLDWTARLTRDQNGVFHKTFNNIMLLIQNVPELYGCVRKDDFSGRLYAAEELPWRTEKGYWIDADTTELRRYFETRYNGFRPSKADIKDAIVASSVKQKFHPVRDYLNALEWDGIPRLDTLFIDYLGVEDSAYTRAVTRKSLVGAVARVMSPGCKFDYMVVFVGKQGRGKSSMIYKLAGEGDWFTDSVVTFDGSKAFEAVTGKWLVEVPEMHAFDRVTLNQAKAFITKQSDFYRSAYAEFPEDRQRQCVFFGTTNNRECLRDDTGGRRFWTLDTDVIERKKDIFTELSDERDQIWAEAVVRWCEDEPLYLPPDIEAMAEESQEAHREAHPWEETIKNFMALDVPEDWDEWDLSRRMVFWSGGTTDKFNLVPRTKICVREVWQEALQMSLASLDQQKARIIAAIITRTAGWERGGPKRFGKTYGLQKSFIKTMLPSD